MKKMILLAFFALFVISCDGTEDKEQELQRALDSGNFDYVIATLGDCASKKKVAKDDNRSACYKGLSNKEKLDLGAAYFGKAKFYLLSLAKKMEDVKGKANESEEIFKFVFDLLGNDLTKGIKTFETLLPTNLTKKGSKLCNVKDYKKDLDRFAKQACVSINPVLLKDLLNDDDSANRDGVTSLEDLVNVKKLVDSLANGMSSDVVSSLINKDGKATSDTKNDINENKKVDAVEASLCAINKSECKAADKVVRTMPGTGIFNASNNANLNDINLTKITVTNKTGDTNSTFWRLIKQDTTVKKVTIINNTKKFCNSKAEVNATCKKINPASKCYPCPDLAENGKPSTAIESVEEVLNDDDAMASFALTKSNKDDGKTQTQKTEELRQDICKDAVPACATSSGKTVVTQEAFMQYLQKDKK